MCNEIEQLKAEIKEIDNAQTKLAETKGQKQTELAKLLCPYKVGDVGTLCGYSYKGSRAIIDSVFLKYSYWVCSATIYKKDGTKGNRRVEFWNQKDFELEV